SADTAVLLFLIILSMSSLPPKSTLFPYTTLFRSNPKFHPSRSPCFLRCSNQLNALHLFHLNTRHEYAQDLFLMHDCCANPWLTVDRKSTRLNSSHVKISYAVFCLKTTDNAMQHRS